MDKELWIKIKYTIEDVISKALMLFLLLSALCIAVGMVWMIISGIHSSYDVLWLLVIYLIFTH